MDAARCSLAIADASIMRLMPLATRACWDTHGASTIWSSGLLKATPRFTAVAASASMELVVSMITLCSICMYSWEAALCSAWAVSVPDSTTAVQTSCTTLATAASMVEEGRQ